MDALAFVIGQEEAELKLFIGALQDEQDALKTGNTDRLEKVVELKNRHIESLARLGHQRNQLLKSQRLADDREGLNLWAKTSGQGALVEGFLRFVDEARELNRLNGQLIAMRMTNTQSALAALTPHRMAGQGLYGPKGLTKYSSGYRLIDTV